MPSLPNLFINEKKIRKKIKRLKFFLFFLQFQEYHIEESISRLIVEDEDEESLPVRIRSRPIPAIKVGANYF